MTTSPWHFDNSYLTLPSVLYSQTKPIPVRTPKLFSFNRELAQELFSKPILTSEDPKSKGIAAAWFSGNSIPSGAQPIAQAYAGHQFGNFVPLLGDGRAILLGEHISRDGKRHDVQLKGSGRTTFSRNGDGRAALGPMIREYIIGEFLTAVGIPSTRALAVTLTGERIQRQTPLDGAVLTRIADSHIRIGTFEYLHARNDSQAIQALANYCLHRHYPECVDAPQPIFSLCKAFTERCASLVAAWMNVGFIHGVLNTDNIAISGQSIDFGPCAFIDTYDPATMFSSIDTHGRYAFGAQPSIMQWNLARFLETVLFLLDESTEHAIEIAHDLLQHFQQVYTSTWRSELRNKLGLTTNLPDDSELLEQFLKILHSETLDYTLTLRQLADGTFIPQQDSRLSAWHTLWRKRITEEQNGRPIKETLRLIEQRNPLYIPRNYLVEETLETCATTLQDTALNELLLPLRNPYQEMPNCERFAKPPSSSWNNYQTFCGT